jgi:hypothetical protein
MLDHYCVLNDPSKRMINLSNQTIQIRKQANEGIVELNYFCFIRHNYRLKWSFF